MNARRYELTALYREQLEELAPTVTVPFEQARGKSACHLMPILLPAGCERIGFMEKLKSQGIQTSIHYPPIHKFRTYAGAEAHFELPHTENVTEREVTLPLYPALSDEKVSAVVEAVRDAVNS
jgi:dTDP-4-amino-4,6-dideoxygalactose transaminase